MATDTYHLLHSERWQAIVKRGLQQRLDEWDCGAFDVRYTDEKQVMIAILEALLDIDQRPKKLEKTNG